MYYHISGLLTTENLYNVSFFIQKTPGSSLPGAVVLSICSSAEHLVRAAVIDERRSAEDRAALNAFFFSIGCGLIRLVVSREKMFLS